MTEGSTRILVNLPYSLREYAGGKDAVEVNAATLAGAIEELNGRFPGLAYRILDDQGRLRKYVNAFVNDEPVSHMEPMSVLLHDGDAVYILPSVAGG